MTFEKQNTFISRKTQKLSGTVLQIQFTFSCGKILLLDCLTNDYASTFKIIKDNFKWNNDKKNCTTQSQSMHTRPH